MSKKAGIIADNYKVPEFKKQLDEAGFVYETTPFNHNCTTITITTTQKDIERIARICQLVEINSKRGN